MSGPSLILKIKLRISGLLPDTVRVPGAGKTRSQRCENAAPDGMMSSFKNAETRTGLLDYSPAQESGPAAPGPASHNPP